MCRVNAFITADDGLTALVPLKTLPRRGVKWSIAIWKNARAVDFKTANLSLSVEGVLSDLDNALTHSHTCQYKCHFSSTTAAPPPAPWDHVPKFGLLAVMSLG